MRRIAALLLIGTMLAPAAGRAQTPLPGNPGFKPSTGPGQGAAQKPAQPPPPPTARPLAWPRLDRGAVLCKTESDLNRLAERRQGSDAGNVDCQVMRVATPISILQRKGSAVTQVKTSDPAAGGVGWTDAWLPDKAPVH